MKRYLINIVVFFVIVAICDICFGYIFDYMQTHPKGGETKLFNDLMINDCHDVLILGSSRAHHHYDPDVLEQQLGLECYNAGYNGNGVILAYPILYNMLKRSCKPQLVIYEVSAGFDILKNSNDDENYRYIGKLKPYYRIPVVGQIIQSVYKSNYIQCHSGLFRHNSEFLTIAKNFINYHSMDYKGFRPLKGTFSCINRVESHLSQEHDQLKLHWLHKLASLKKNHNLNMIWVISPQFDSVNVKHDTYATAKHIAKQYNIPFYDYYFDTTFVGHTEYFKDATHMNSEGAKVFSKKIAHELSLYLVQNK